MKRDTVEAFVILLLLILVVAKSITLVLILAPPTLLYFISKAWLKYSLKKIIIVIKYPRHNFFTGDEIELQVIAENHAWFPIPNVTLYLELPRELELIKPKTVANQLEKLLHFDLNIRARERVRTKILCKARSRGWYQVEDASIKIADVFSWNEVYSKNIVNEDYCIVYPDVRELAQWPILNTTPFGHFQSQSWLYRDPLNIAGLREYENQSITEVDWKATAKVNELIVRQVHASFAPSAAVFFDVVTSQYYWRVRLDRFEIGVKIAASILRYLQQHNSPFSLYTNGVNLALRGELQYLSQGMGTAHLGRALAILAAVEPIQLASNWQTLLKLGNLWSQQSIIYITAYLDEKSAGILAKMAGDGHSVTVIWLGDVEDVPKLPRVHIVMMKEVVA